jgi:hypothetical protein
MPSEDIAYYQQRASVERDRAKSAPTAEIAAIHEQLSAHYEDVVRSMRSAQSSDVSDLLHPEGLRDVRSRTGSWAYRSPGHRVASPAKMTKPADEERAHTALAHLRAAMVLLDREGLQMAASRLAMAIDEVEDAMAEALLKRERPGPTN